MIYMTLPLPITCRRGQTYKVRGYGLLFFAYQLEVGTDEQKFNRWGQTNKVQ